MLIIFTVEFLQDMPLSHIFPSESVGFASAPYLLVKHHVAVSETSIPIESYANNVACSVSSLKEYYSFMYQK